MKALTTAYDKLETAYEQLEQTTAAKERIESELRIARDIQMSMVPNVFPERSDIDIYASMNPAKEVGGDLYDFFINGDRLYFCVGDVSGKGVPASLLMSVAINLFRTVAKEGFPPAYVATRMNDTLTSENSNSMFVTMFIAQVDLKKGRMDFCNCGHNPPILINEMTTDGREARFIDMMPNAPLGLWPELEFKGEFIENINGQTLLVYTDGLNEAENTMRDQFSDDRLLEVIRMNKTRSARQIIELLQEQVSKFVGEAEPSDDITMLCLRTGLSTH
jgi:serine phosphatase RsbU (regulator of sigma subunit)